MSLPEQPHQRALALFLADRPALQETLDHLNPLAAQAAGLTQQQYREERLHEAFEEEAQRLGLFAWELTLQLTTESPQHFEAQRLEVHKEVAEMAGMEWAEYCELNGLNSAG
ncbi:hypothetical protein M2401_002913 [Pseudomonas sp. JUb42]|jgi:hypothetical protein|uniref:DUF6388 family protein n=1 Tax=Pseudomonas sp. JUb42 TaxID=2940611 RepID=UPI0021685C5E|nr:DUF6388 family protein [Pseudomonas sp. JUb42]MCS3469175.1 hypothetical protein [Pseudomonas sp. JUb42]